MEFKRSFGVIIPVVRKDIEERPHQVKALARNVRHLENGAYPLTDELGRCIDCLLPVLDENWYFPSPRGFEYSRQLGDSLLQDLGRANINFGDHHHHRHIEGKSNTQMLSTPSISSSRSLRT